MAGQTCRCTVLLAPMDQSQGASKTWMDDKYTLWLLQQPAPLTHPLLPRPTVPKRQVGITCCVLSCGCIKSLATFCGLDDLCLHGIIIVGLYVRRLSSPPLPCPDLPGETVTIY